MNPTRLFLLAAAYSLSAAATTLHAADPLTEHVLTLDPTGHPRADLNLSSTHVTGTLDAARLPAGVGSAFLAGVARPTGTDATALDHASLVGVSAGDVRQVVFTTGDLSAFTGGIDRYTGLPLAYVAATYRLVNTVGATALPDRVATQTTGKAWNLVSAALSSGDIVLPNGNVLWADGTFCMMGGVLLADATGSSFNLKDHIEAFGGTSSIGLYGSAYMVSNGGHLNLDGYNLELGGNISIGANAGIDTSNGGGYINTSNNGGANGYINTSGDGVVVGGYINTSVAAGVAGGTINTSAGGAINTSAGGGSVNTSSGGGSIDLSGDGSPYSAGDINTGSYGGGISTANSGGGISTANYGGLINTSGHGSPEGSFSAPVGSLYCDQDGTAGHVLYVKEPGADDYHGWAAK